MPSPRPFLPWMALALLAACGGTPPAAEPARPPSLILVSIDTLRRDHLGLYGYGRDTSPKLDRLAKECVVFDHVYSSAPSTLISHMTMLTGLFPSQHGVVSDGTQLAPEIPTLAERLHAAGYFTAAVYLPGWIHERFGFNRGFDLVANYEEGASDKSIRDVAPPVFAQLPTDRPFFLFLHIFDVHCGNLDAPGSTIYEPPAPFDTMFLADARERLVGLDARGVFSGEVLATRAQREAIDALYDGGIRFVDDTLGGWIEGWRAAGLLDRSLLVITADHGEELGQRDGLGGHGSSFEEGLRVPLLIRYPDARDAGQRRTTPVGLVDVVPTALAALGLAADDWLPGRPLVGSLQERRLLFMNRPPSSAIIEYPWKYATTNRFDATPGKIYNLLRDPAELDPIDVEHHPQAFRRFQAELTNDAAQERAGWAPLPGTAVEADPGSEADLEALRAIGYLGGG